MAGIEGSLRSCAVVGSENVGARGSLVTEIHSRSPVEEIGMMNGKENKKDQVPCPSIKLLVSWRPLQVEINQHPGVCRVAATDWEIRVQRVGLKLRDKSCIISITHPVGYIASTHTFPHILELQLPYSFILSLNRMQLHFEQKETPKWGDTLCPLSLYPFLGNVYRTNIWTILISFSIQTQSHLN